MKILSNGAPHSLFRYIGHHTKAVYKCTISRYVKSRKYGPYGGTYTNIVKTASASLYFHCYNPISYSGHPRGSKKYRLAKMWGGGCTRVISGPRPILYSCETWTTNDLRSTNPFYLGSPKQMLVVCNTTCGHERLDPPPSGQYYIYSRVCICDLPFHAHFSNTLYLCQKSRYSFHLNVYAILKPNLFNYVPFDSVKHLFQPYLAD